MNAFTLITKYLTKALDTVFATESKTAVLENGQKFIDVNFEQAGYVRVMDILMDGLSDYYRANKGGLSGTGTNFNGAGHNDGYQIGNVSAKWQIYQLGYDRGKQFQVDNMDDEEEAGKIIANLLTEFLRTKVVPEVDAIRFSKIAGKAYASLGNLVSETVAANTIITKFNTAFEWLTEHEVPEDEQVIFVSPAIWTLISNTTELYKKLTQEEYTSAKGVTFNFQAYMGRPIIVVPSDRFYTNVVTNANGYAPGTGSKIINYMVCSKKAIVPIVKLEKSKVFGPEVVQDFDGYKVNFRIYHDVVIPKNKIIGSYVSVSAVDAGTKTSAIYVALTGATKTSKTLDSYYTLPAGMLGTVIHAATAFALGATATSGELATAIAVGDTFTPAGADNEYFALADASNTIIAVSAAVAL